MDTEQGTPAWFNARKGKLTASNFGAAAGVNPYQSRKRSLQEAVGEIEWKGNMDACLWGTKNERNAVKDYMVRTGNVVRSKGFFGHPDYAWLGGSPDGLVGDVGMIEVKCPFGRCGDGKCHDEIPAHYYCQVNGLMEILNREWCDFVSWTPHEMRIYRVWRDSSCFNYLLDRYTIFYAYMKAGSTAIPALAHGEKTRVLERIALSQREHVQHDAWARTSEGAIPDFSDSCSDGSGDVGSVPSPQSPADADRAPDRVLHGGAEAELPVA